MKHVRFLLPLLLLVVFLPAQADVVKGRFVDAETGQPLPETVASITMKSELVTVQWGLAVDSLGRFQSEASGDRLQLEANLIGYYPVKRTFMAGTGKDTLDLGDIALRPSEVFLKSATVSAKAKRFVMRGDTVVFNPDAFNLEEGARLDELLKKLPGVSVKDGKLYWMDKPVRILMNGEELFGDNGLFTNRLPAEAVQDIKAYNKASEMKEQTGLDDGAEDHVLDITIKPGFLDRWYGDVEGNYQTTDGYLARLDALYLSTHDPLMAFGNWENINRNYFQKTFNSSSSGSSAPYGKQLFGAAGYKHQWKQEQGNKTLDKFVSLSASAGHTDSWGKDWSNLETFFPGQERTFGLTDSRYSTHKVDPAVNFYSRLKLDSVSGLNINADWSYKRQDNTSETRSAIFADNPYALDESPLDAVFTTDGLAAFEPILTTRSSYRQLTQNEGQKLSANAGFWHFFKDKSQLRLGASFGYSDDETEGRTERDIRYYREAASQQLSSELTRTPAHSLNAGANADYSKWLGKKVYVQLGYGFAHNNDFRRERRYRLSDLPEYAPTAPLPAILPDDVLDAANSYRDKRRTDLHSVSLAATLNLTPLSLMPSLSMERSREHMDYRRGTSEATGSVDTTATRHLTLWRPALTARWKLNRSSALEGNYSYATSAPDLLQTIGYTDSSDPLFVTQGNPDLENEHSHKAGLKYIGNFVKRQQSIIAGITYTKNVSPVGSVFFYNPETGAYRTTQANVRGGYEWSVSLSYEQALGDFLRLRNDITTSLGESYGYLTAVAPDYELLLNRARSIYVLEQPELSFEDDKLFFSLSGRYEMRHRSNSLTYDYNNHLTHYRARLEARYKWRKFTFATDFNLRGYQGYAMSSMNRVRPIWNAQVDWKILRNKGRITLELNDILDKENYFNASVTATERKEIRNEFIHHYVNIGFTYHFDAKKTEEGKQREKRRQSLGY